MQYYLLLFSAYYSKQVQAAPANSIIVRCALTFLAITSPGLSKRCERCGREFLNEHFEPVKDDTALTIHDDDDHRGAMALQPSLACWLYRKFDICPYCCGKFVG